MFVTWVNNLRHSHPLKYMVQAGVEMSSLPISLREAGFVVTQVCNEDSLWPKRQYFYDVNCDKLHIHLENITLARFTAFENCVNKARHSKTR